MTIRPGSTVSHVRFTEHITRVEAKFKCACGNRFKRVVTRSWTENPFHQWRGREHELNQQCLAECKEALKEWPCPKCETTCTPKEATK